jgi:UDPglucose 6-dehydrogenase
MGLHLVKVLFFLSIFCFVPFISGLNSVKNPQEIAVVGTGYVGLVLGTCLAEIGHKVTCCDVDFNKISSLQQGHIPIYETGLEELVIKNRAENRLFFTSSLENAIRESDVIFITVGTPETLSGEANLEYVFAVAKMIGENLRTFKTVFVKSTVPMGTVLKIKEVITEHNTSKTPFSIGYAPEFLREGSSVSDFMHPDRVVIGAEDPQTSQLFTEIVQPILDDGAKICTTSIASAEMIKYASNSFLAVKISFINEIANFCEEIGADVEEVALGIGLDKRIGQSFLKPGPGYGGSCFPKDTLAFLKTAQKNGVDLSIVEAAVGSNNRRCEKILFRLQNALGTLENKKIALLGLAFKELTDDVRESPSLKMIEKLHEKKAFVTSFDPIASTNALKFLPDLAIASTLYEVFAGCDAIIVATPWSLFTEIDWKKVKEVSQARVVFDTRNILDPEEIEQAGFLYIGIGKKGVKAH